MFTVHSRSEGVAIVWRIRLTAEDVARITIAPSLGPTAETIFALDLFAQKSSRTAFVRWRQHVRAALNTRARSVGVLARYLRPIPELYRLMEAFDVSASPTVGDQRRQEVALAFRFFYQTAVEPHWRQIQAYLEAEREACGRIMLSGGVEQLLNSLNSQVKWDGDTLEIRRRQPGQTLTLGGKGLTIVPSLFLGNGPTIVHDPNAPHRRPILLYPATVDVTSSASLWREEGPNGNALGPLLGRTRAAALEALTECRNTSQLGQRLGISSAAASQHTAVLREAGLITSRRSLNTVLHTVTPLGSAMLKGGYSPEPQVSRPELDICERELA